tara:strand:- start:337 stop:963 length:627 start_codon:yes stop_codon:yes gene_type:complete
MEKIQPSRKDIIQDIRNWSANYLEVRNEHLGGMPACPFARSTWKLKKVRIEIKPKKLWYKKTLNEILEKFNWNKHEILIFCDLYFSYSPDDLGDVTEAYNNFYNSKDLYFMSFHPDNPATVEEQEFLVHPGDDYDYSISYPIYSYSMMLVQKFSQLQEASDKLHKMGYYDKWPKDYYNEVVKSRYDKYNKLFGGTYGSKKEIKGQKKI